MLAAQSCLPIVPVTCHQSGSPPCHATEAARVPNPERGPFSSSSREPPGASDPDDRLSSLKHFPLGFWGTRLSSPPPDFSFAALSS